MIHRMVFGLGAATLAVAAGLVAIAMLIDGDLPQRDNPAGFVGPGFQSQALMGVPNDGLLSAPSGRYESPRGRSQAGLFGSSMPDVAS